MSGSAEARAAHNETERAVRAAWQRVEPDKVRRFIQNQPDVIGDVDLIDMREPETRSGMSNGIAFLQVALDLGQGRELRDLVLRYSPGVGLLKQKSFVDEFWTARAAIEAGIPAPWPLWVDGDGKTLGLPGLVMERVYGETAAAGLYSEGIIARATPELRKSMLLEAAAFHGRLRRAAIGPEQVPHLLRRGVGASDIERELAWLMGEAVLNTEPGDAKRQDIARIRDWMRDNQPAVRPGTLVHGDPQVANSVFRDGKVVASLDWELAYLGHGETDLAILIYYTHLLKIYDRDIPGTPSAEEYVARFEEAAGARVENFDYFRLFGMYKLVCLILCTAKTMPNFEPYWDHVWGDLVAAWEKCRRSTA